MSAFGLWKTAENLCPPGWRGPADTGLVFLAISAM